MRIGIDGYNLAMPHGTGVATYGITLAETLRSGGFAIDGVFGIRAGRNPALRETLFFDRFGRGDRAAGRRLLPAYAPFLRLRATPVPQGEVDTRHLAGRWPGFGRLVTAPDLFALAHRHFATFGRFVPLRMPDPPPIMHWTYPVPIELVGARNIYTVHDLVPLTLPFATLTAKRTYRALLAGCVERAAQICTVSEASRAEILRSFGGDGTRVTNCYQSLPPIDDPLDADGAANAVERTLGLKRDGYFLFYGAIEPKKNLARLIEAHLARETATTLVLVGGPGWESERETALLRPDPSLGSDHAGRLAARVVQLERLPRLLLMRLVRGAKAVVFPSIAEGFGLPVLEAMRVGTPVLTSGGGALAEIAGDAALLVDPFDVDSIGAGLHALDTDRDLRARLRTAGPARAACFSPSRYLERLQDMYAAVMARS